MLGAAALASLGWSLGGELREVVVLGRRARLGGSNSLAASLLLIGGSGAQGSAALGSSCAKSDRRHSGEGGGEREHGHSHEEGEESGAGHFAGLDVSQGDAFL